MNAAMPSASVGAIYADVKPTRRAVSISSVDSEPIVRAASTRSVASSASINDEGRGQRGWLALEGDDLPLEDSAVADEALVLPLRQISEAPVAVVHTASEASRSFVAEALPETLTMGAGTRLCLTDGTCVGVVSSILGPVKQAFYLVKSTRHDFCELLSAHRLAEGVSLHYDLLHQQIIYDPFHQCDAAKGTDASYINDEELPEYVRPDFSDDEKEIQWKRQKRRRSDDNVSISSDEPPEEIEWSKLQLDDDAGPREDAHVLVPQWLRGALR
ncbi:hypothetical protein LSCM1_02056 [Leishmania martiniquensis]|uniref:H/ACA ribonucleoprotein complex subunit n=1 Tax=Leishmania martiniquensis TaxID=1580590 RepID=A0A836G9Q1_9TRYP|nr:hypothetical protein LSCM1_02056 [Leishmania martiniquensis]